MNEVGKIFLVICM